MSSKKIAPYGTWRSPITAELIVSGAVGFTEAVIDGEDIYWAERRPKEGGRSVIARYSPNGEAVELTPAPFNSRTLVHEYGGGDFLASNGSIYFSNFSDQRIYKAALGKEPFPITDADKHRYADARIDSLRHRLICILEDHSGEGKEPVNSVVAVSLEDGSETSLVSGCDFYSSPRISPDCRRIAWLSWNHPNMPWDGTELWTGEFDEEGLIKSSRLVAGGPAESIFQPEWSPEGKLIFASDKTGWWNLYVCGEEGTEPLCPMEAEFGSAQWVFGMSFYAFESAGRIICAYSKDGTQHLASLDLSSKKLEPIPSRHTEIWSVRAAKGRAVFCAGSPQTPSGIVSLDLDKMEFSELRRSSNLEIGEQYLSVPEAVEFPTENGLTAHGFYYAPKNRDYEAPTDEKPPLIVISHGGPTADTTTMLSLSIQFWTSRGFAVLDVNYGGSTGYGRAYRERLNGNWGVVDVDDCVNGARWAAQQGKADPERLIIRGGSAGGYTTLCALTFRNVFKAGASYYGVSDLEALDEDTHKFESRYSVSLIGPYPERKDLYVERSPVHFADQLSCPIIFLQGLEDKVVPPNQSVMMFEAAVKKGIPAAYVPFEGEQHGFRKAENIKRSLESELYFYSKVLGFELADPVEPVKIANL